MTPHRSKFALACTKSACALVLGLKIGASLASPLAPPEPRPADAAGQITLNALAFLGVNYRYGGTSPDSGFDCSGLVRHVFGDVLGVTLPRRSEEISRVGGKIAKTELQPGDLVFFNTLRRAFSHVGIYIGDKRFVHAPSSGGGIRIDRLDASYWVRRFNGARRLITERSPGSPQQRMFVPNREPAVGSRLFAYQGPLDSHSLLDMTAPATEPLIGSDSVNPL